MGNPISAIRVKIRQFLRDEFVSGQDFEWEDDEIDIHIQDCLVEISQRRPYEVKETLQTTAGSKKLDISSISDLLDVKEVEYPVGSDPPEYRNCSVFGDTLRIDTTITPSADEDVYLYCHKVHEVTETSSSLKPDLERVLVMGAVARLALAWLNTIRTEIKIVVSTISNISTAVSNMSARVTQAINDLTTGRASIGVKLTEATTAIGNMSARITQSITDITDGRALIGSKKTQAISALDAISAQITQAIADLTSGRAQISDMRTTADTAIDNMLARITQAQTDLTDGRTLINKINIGGAPEDDYANYAGRELSIAVGYLNQARGYLGEAVTSDGYQAYAARDLQVANTYINQARGYLALDVVTNEYGSMAARELANASIYLSQARGYLALDVKSGPYASYASRELANATAYLNQAGGYAREVASRLSIASAMAGYERWANNQLILYQRALRSISKPKVICEYPKD